MEIDALETTNLQNRVGNTLLHGAVISDENQEIKRLLATRADPASRTATDARRL
jgi:ankyrin repeat protein